MQRSSSAQPSPGRSAPPRQGGSASFDSLFSGVQQGLGAFTQGAQTISSLASLFNAPGVSNVASQLAQGTGQVSSMLQGLQSKQVPPLPGPAPAPAVSPMGPAPAAFPGAGPSVGAGGQLDATALLGLLLSNPQLQQALRAAPVFGQAAPQAVNLVVPAESGATTVALPLEDVVNTVAELANRSAAELIACTSRGASEAAPYLVDEEGEHIVDPSRPQDRAALVLHYFRLAGEAERFGEQSEADLNESDAWAIEAGFED